MLYLMNFQEADALIHGNTNKNLSSIFISFNPTKFLC